MYTIAERKSVQKYSHESLVGLHKVYQVKGPKHKLELTKWIGKDSFRYLRERLQCNKGFDEVKPKKNVFSVGTFRGITNTKNWKTV